MPHTFFFFLDEVSSVQVFVAKNDLELLSPLLALSRLQVCATTSGLLCAGEPTTRLHACYAYTLPTEHPHPQPLTPAVTSSWSSICCFSFSMSWLCWLISSSCQRREGMVRGYFAHFRMPGPEEEARSQSAALSWKARIPKGWQNFALNVLWDNGSTQQKSPYPHP